MHIELINIFRWEKSSEETRLAPAAAMPQLNSNATWKLLSVECCAIGRRNASPLHQLCFNQCNAVVKLPRF